MSLIISYYEPYGHDGSHAALTFFSIQLPLIPKSMRKIEFFTVLFGRLFKQSYGT